ncbi:MAG: response regulator [Armatimonadetes bacterium]|nr:response regulator [Armatimonadota bacterium]
MGAKVLVVEDEESARLPLVHTVESAGFSVLQESDGGNVGRTVSDEQPDVILLDLTLPRLDGFQVLRQIKETEVGRQIPVVVLTTSPDRPDMVKAYNMGANAYVTKPFSLESFSTMTQALKSFWIDQNRTIFHVT